MKKYCVLILVFVLCASTIGCGKLRPQESTTGTIPTTTAEPTIQETWETLPPQEPSAEDPTGYKVNGTMQRPDYSFRDMPSAYQLRMMAVRAMKDTLSIRWSTADGIFYYKTGPVSNKHFQHQPDTTYAGVIYSNASTGIFQFYEYYDPETGRLNFPGDGDQIKHVLGSSCADCLIWGWNTVCNSITGPYYPNTMVQANGYLPVGSYTYKEDLKNFATLPTKTIIEQNGQDVIIDAYTRMLPADALVSTTDNHGMMVIEIPVIKYYDSGKVNVKESYVMIQDQRGGTGAGFYEHTEGGELIQYSGRTSAKFTFEKLLEKHYIPVTTAEFAGLEEYEQPTVTASPETVTTFQELMQVEVTSNYPMAVLNVWIADREGNRVLLERKCFGGAEDSGVPRSYVVGMLESVYNFESSQWNVPSYILEIEIVSSTGKRFTPVTYTVP